jgi:hypothetical protein
VEKLHLHPSFQQRNIQQVLYNYELLKNHKKPENRLLINLFCREFEFSFPLKNLKPSTNYEVRADIKKTSLLSSLHFVGYVKNGILITSLDDRHSHTVANPQRGLV